MKNDANLSSNRPMSTFQAAEFATSLTCWARNEFHYKRIWADLAWANVVCIRASRVDLYFRHSLKNPQTGFSETALVIARMAFKEQRAGHGRSLLQFLLKVQPEYGFQSLALECASTPSIHEFARKFGFEEICNPGRQSDYLATVESLSASVLAKN